MLQLVYFCSAYCLEIWLRRDLIRKKIENDNIYCVVKLANLVTINDRLGVTFNKELLLSQVFHRAIKYPRISINFKLSQY